MANFEIPRENWTGRVQRIKIGESLEAGGANTLPFLKFEGDCPLPRLGMEIFDVDEDLGPEIKEAFPTKEPVGWAKAAVAKGAELLSLRLVGTNPERANRSTAEAVETVTKITKLDIPLIINGSGHEEKDKEVLRACAEATQGKNCFLGSAEPERYKSTAASALAYGHGVVGLTNIDINLVKQLNILLKDIGVPPDKILIDPMTGALGYGLEYTYSTIERIRLGALQGDEMFQMPILCYASEAWNTRDAQGKLGVEWEAVTGLACGTAGADILIMRHPESFIRLKKAFGGI